MATTPPSNTTVAHGLDEGIELALRADSTGDWKAVADWLAGNPAHAAGLADFLAAQRGLQAALAPLLASPERAGAALGEFELKGELGKGGMGVVHRAFDTTLKREVAVKLLRSGEAFSAVEAARFRYEAEVVASLDHPNIVPVLAFGEADAGPYLVMPLMAGGSLARWLEKRADRQLDAKEAARIVRDVALGVHHAHQRGLIHRDLKPGNILLDAHGTPHVADFGLARRFDATATTRVAGTPAYMAPEQARGEKGLTTAVDLHALGAILFELLAGQPPFGTGDIASVFRRIAEEPPPAMGQFRKDVPADLEAICRKCLEKNPANRYSSAQELADDLGRFLAGEPVLARPRTIRQRIREAVARPAEARSYISLSLVLFGCLHHPVVHVLLTVMVLAGARPEWTFAVMMYHLAAWFGQFWWFNIRRFAELNPVEQLSISSHMGTWVAVVLLLPLHVAFFGLDIMPIYPALNAVVGTACFILGAIYAGRMYLLALLILGQNVAMVFLPFWAWPLLHGLGGGTVFVLFGLHLRRAHEAARPDSDAPASPPHRANP